MSGDMPKVWWCAVNRTFYVDTDAPRVRIVSSRNDTPEEAVELVPVSAEHVDARALELSYWFGRLQYAKADDLPRFRGLMRDRIEELDEQGDAIAYTAVSDAPPAPVETEWAAIHEDGTVIDCVRDGYRAVRRTVIRSAWREVSDDV